MSQPALGDSSHGRVELSTSARRSLTVPAQIAMRMSPVDQIASSLPVYAGFVPLSIYALPSVDVRDEFGAFRGSDHRFSLM